MAVASIPIDPDILEAKRRRLDELELRAARLGYSTPPEVATEIADLKRELAEAEAPGSPAEMHLEVRRTLARHGQILAAHSAAMLIILLLLLVMVSRIVPESRQAQQPYTAPAPTAGIARPAISPVAGAGAPLTGGR